MIPVLVIFFILANTFPSISSKDASQTAINSSKSAIIHDIVGPFPLFQIPLALIIILSLILLILGLIWWYYARGKLTSLTPRQRALNALVHLRAQITEGTDHDFGVYVSDVLRQFLEEAFGFRAPRQSTEEFLISMQESQHFVASEQKSSLIKFLHHVDDLKYARGEANLEQRLALMQSAESFITTSQILSKDTESMISQISQKPPRRGKRS